MFSTTITVLGGDLRQCYLADYMCEMGHDVTCYGTMPFSYKYKDEVNMAKCLKDAVSEARFILCPVPFTKNGQYLNVSPESTGEVSLGVLLDFLRPGQILIGGSIPESFIIPCQERQVTAIDFMTDVSLIERNAVLTAEGLYSLLISETPCTLNGKKVLLMGFGRCGQAIGRLLRLNDLIVTACDKKEEALAAARRMGIVCLTPSELKDSDYDLVINTIPMEVLRPEQIKQLREDCILFEIASASGFNEEARKARGLKLVRCPGIPGRFMPKTAGELIGKSILERMLSHGF